MKTQNSNQPASTETKKVLWFSQHEMNEEQRKALGECEVTQVDGTAPNVHVPFSALINGSKEEVQVKPLKELVQDFDVIAVVLPINIKQQLLNFTGDKPVIEAGNARVRMQTPTANGSKFNFVFQKWIRIVRIEVVTEDFVM